MQLLPCLRVRQHTGDSCNSPTPSSCSSPACEGVFLLQCFLNENIFLLSAAFFPFVPAFPALKRCLLASLPCSLAVLGIPDHHFHVRTSQSSLSSVFSASLTQRRPNLETHGWMCKSQTIIPFCTLLHQLTAPCESRASGRQQALQTSFPHSGMRPAGPQQHAGQPFTRPECPQALKGAKTLLSTQELGHWALCVAGIWVVAAGTTCARDTVGTQQSLWGQAGLLGHCLGSTE